MKESEAHKTKLIDFQVIAKYHKISIMLYEPKKDGRMDERSTWQLVYGKIRYISKLPLVNMRLLGGHCFYIKKEECTMQKMDIQKLQADI